MTNYDWQISPGVIRKRTARELDDMIAISNRGALRTAIRQLARMDANIAKGVKYRPGVVDELRAYIANLEARVA